METHEIEAMVEKLLIQAQVKVEFTLRGETIRDNDWKCDEWQVTVSKPGQPQQRFEYFTGTGHRKVRPVDRVRILNDYRGSRLLQHYLDQAAKPVEPHPAAFLFSLVNDSDAEGHSFNDWCANYGYSSDSISAFNTYQACCDYAVRLRRIFNHEQIAQLREALQDY